MWYVVVSFAFRKDHRIVTSTLLVCIHMTGTYDNTSLSRPRALVRGLHETMDSFSLDLAGGLRTSSVEGKITVRPTYYLHDMKKNVKCTSPDQRNDRFLLLVPAPSCFHFQRQLAPAYQLQPPYSGQCEILRVVACTYHTMSYGSHCRFRGLPGGHRRDSGYASFESND